MDQRINWLLLVNAMLGTFLSGAASRIFNISLPTVAQSLGTDLAGVSWAYLGYQLSNVGLSLVFGRVGDLYGREKIFGIGFAVFALSSLLCGLSQSIVDLIIFRMLQGAGGAMIQSISRALASEAMPEELSGRAQSAMTTAFHTGFLLGPTLGGVIIDTLNWRWTFFILFPVGAAGSALSLVNVKRRKEPARKNPVDYFGAFLLFAMATLLVLFLDRRVTEIRSSSPVCFLYRISVCRSARSHHSPGPVERPSVGSDWASLTGKPRRDFLESFPARRDALQNRLPLVAPDNHARAERRR